MTTDGIIQKVFAKLLSEHQEAINEGHTQIMIYHCIKDLKELQEELIAEIKNLKWHHWDESKADFQRKLIGDSE